MDPPVLIYSEFYVETQGGRVRSWDSVGGSPAALLQSAFTSSSGSTEGVWAEGFVQQRCPGVQQPRLEMATKAAAAAAAPPHQQPLLLDGRFSSYLWSRCCHRRSDGEEQEHGNHWRRTLFWTCPAPPGPSPLLCSHPGRWLMAPLGGCPACAEAPWLWRRSVRAARTETDWRGRPALTSSPDHLGPVKRVAKNTEFRDALTPQYIWFNQMCCSSEILSYDLHMASE